MLSLFQAYSDPSHSDENQILISESEQNQMVVDFIRAFSDRLPICIQREIKLSEEIQINLLRTFQWFSKHVMTSDGF